MNRTKIEWADYTWSPITGCTKRCAYCYAHRLAKGRLRRRYLANPNVAPGCDPSDPFTPRFWADRLDEPFNLKTPSKIFVCSMGEIFDPSVSWEWKEEVLAAAGEADWHTFQFLTKQPLIAQQFTFPANAWAGVTIENGGLLPQIRLHRFASVEAPVRFISLEPLTGPVTSIPGWVDWIIIGAMTGPGAMKPRPEWVQGLIDEADKSGIPVFLKDNLHWTEVRQEWPKGE
jgi:protein gp37